jgi:CRISPR-associated protein Cas1
MRAARDAARPSAAEALQTAAKRISARIVEVQSAATVDALRGLEGESAVQYFAAMNDLLGVDDERLRFSKRSRRPPLDPINALLSFVYTLLLHDVRSACEATGLDPAVGFLHRDRPGRPGMALDLMEEFRSWLADRLVLSLLNRRQLGPADFQLLESGAVVMTDPARKTVLVNWQNRKQEIVTHPLLGEKMSIGLLMHVQARLLARYLRGDMDAYPPYLWR